MQWNVSGRWRIFLVFWSLFSSAVFRTAAEPTPAEGVNSITGIWVWQSAFVEDADQRGELLAFCRQRGVNRLLVQIHFGPDGQQIVMPERLKEFLLAANEASIKVEALDGSPEMGLAAQRDRTLHRLKSVLAIQKTLPKGQGFAGLHYDIEPYLTARWKSGDLQAVASETVATLAAIQREVKDADPDLTISYDIPYWYEKKDDLMLDYGGRHQNFQRYIQDLSDYVGIMSYRRTATGPNSVAEISAPILSYAAETGKKACVSLETVPLKTDAQISFHGTSSELFSQVIDQLRAHLNGSPGFGGILLHDYVHVRALLENQPEKTEAKASPQP